MTWRGTTKGLSTKPRHRSFDEQLKEEAKPQVVPESSTIGKDVLLAQYRSSREQVMKRNLFGLLE